MLRTLAVAVTATLLTLGPTPPPAPAARPSYAASVVGSVDLPLAERPAPTCQGRRATIVGANRKDGRAVGTQRADVIVTAGATRVVSRGGNDTVCVRGRLGRGVRADLGRGADTFVGGPGRDVVRTGPTGGADDARDVVRTGRGDDQVVAGSRDGTRDVVTLGEGDDVLVIGRQMQADARAQGGPGRDTILVDRLPGTTPGVRGDLTLDTRTGTGTRDGAPWLRVAGLESYALPSPHGHTLSFTGSDVDERLRLPLDYARTPSAAGTIDMGGGDDVVVLRADERDRTITGGPGTDLLHVLSYGRAGPDFPDPIPTVGFSLLAPLQSAGRDEEGNLTIRDLEDYAIVSTGPLFAIGSPADERFVVSTCSPGDPRSLPSQVFAGSGDDLLVAQRLVGDGVTGPSCFGDPVLDGAVSFDGGDGDDVLVGGGSDDTLSGGNDTDSLDGRGGVNTCRYGESVVRCQRLDPRTPQRGR